MKYKRGKGFSLIELMVAMGIIAFLISLSLLGLNILQRNSRDARRVEKLTAISKEVNNFRISNLRYPVSGSDLVFTPEKVTIGTNEVELELQTVSGPQTSTSSTKYFYEVSLTGFVLCAQLESGKVESAGTSPCPNSI